MAMPEPPPAYRRVVLAVWHFVYHHVLFMWPVPLPELKPGKPEFKTLEAELAAHAAALTHLSGDGLDLVINALKDELARTLSDIDGVRSRAGQLLAATGFVAVLASIGSSLPKQKDLIILTYVLLGVAIFGLVGTLWLTTQAARVRQWEPTLFTSPQEFESVSDSAALAVREPASAEQLRHLKERYADELYRACRRDTERLRVPAGYLSDAQWYFFGTIAVIVALVVLQF